MSLWDNSHWVVFGVGILLMMTALDLIPIRPSTNKFGVFCWRGVDDVWLDSAVDLGVKWVHIGQSGRFDWRNDPSYFDKVKSVVARIRSRGLESVACMHG